MSLVTPRPFGRVGSGGSGSVAEFGAVVMYSCGATYEARVSSMVW